MAPSAASCQASKRNRITPILKVYADKAQTGQTIDPATGTIAGWRKENYTLVPLRAGQITIPPVTINWWDIAHNRAATATLPARPLNIAAGAPAAIASSAVFVTPGRPVAGNTGPGAIRSSRPVYYYRAARRRSLPGRVLDGSVAIQTSPV